MSLELPKFKAAVVQASPVFLNAEKTVDKVLDIMREVARNGAQLVAFPEVFICAYPYWNWILTPVQGSKWFELLYKSSLTADDILIQKIQKTAKELDLTVVIGMNERGTSFGELYNTNLIIDNTGELVGKHRKLVPTWAEKLTWTSGDGSSLRVYPTKTGNIGTLACGENTNTLARFTLLAQDENVHIANYISLPVAPPDYDMADAIKIRAAAHSFEGKLFTLVSCSTIGADAVKMLEADCPNAAELLSREHAAFSGIIGPTGVPISEPLIDEEGIVYGDIDLSKCIQPKQMHDILGHYNRFDIFELNVNVSPTKRITFVNNYKELEN